MGDHGATSSYHRFTTMKQAPAGHVFDWPPNMLTRLATEYVQAKSRHTIYKAVAAGKLVPTARVGKAMVFSRASLDRFMLGLPPESAPATLRVIRGGKADDASAPQASAPYVASDDDHTPGAA